MRIKKLLTGNDKGLVVPIALMVLAILAIVGITAVVITTMDIKIGKNYQSSEQAFHDAESGINFALGTISNSLEAETFSLPDDIGDTIALPYYTMPSGFTFALSTIEKTGENE